jgi:hypothetical protein
MAYILETCGEAERVAMSEVPKDPDAPVRRIVSFSALGYALVKFLLGQNVNSFERLWIMRWTVSVEAGLVSREEWREEVGVCGGVKAATSFEIDGFSNNVPRETCRFRWEERDERRDSARWEVMPRE